MTYRELMLRTTPGFRPTVSSYREELLCLISLLGIQLRWVRKSPYQGIELVLAWGPLSVITVVGLAPHSRAPLHCYSKQQFKGAVPQGDGYWWLTI